MIYTLILTLSTQCTCIPDPDPNQSLPLHQVHVRLTHLVVWDEKLAPSDPSVALRAQAEKAATSSGASVLFPSYRDPEDI